jgi:hypothetical protein
MFHQGREVTAVFGYYNAGAAKMGNLRDLRIINASAGHPLTDCRFKKQQAGITRKLFHLKGCNNLLQDTACLPG